MHLTVTKCETAEKSSWQYINMDTLTPESIYNLLEKEDCVEKKSLLTKGANGHKQLVVGYSTFGMK